ncbi:hypothetical protein LAUMK7_02383 [Mycobacterium kansasii]|uniref:Uncharacterized protein n=3 Tax=Mycobacterium kansasii TaxID=1768 RepID=A0A653ERV3_MYCKA|nr:hypothetical protein MKANGN_09110 [Mycobacterium kansasii]VAZ59950.1 hypothetical protein LAUMK22_01752 [Mycobacterium kansasii]VAZ66271.1 hypothetical protein LAUMK40_02403 [Mycobacterium kansasii]VAZ74421.1 hypothetical protein LAUMK7_02383 [Mycobacterium kansasii]VTO99505.1 hypothetical protein BIN_B_01972 [Mycobacterium kansasii]
MSLMARHPEAIRLGTRRRGCRGATDNSGGSSRPQRGIRLDHNIIRCPNQVYHAVALQAKAIHDASTAGGASNDVAETVNVAAAC